MSEFIKEVTVMWSLRHPNILLFIGGMCNIILTYVDAIYSMY